MFFTTIYADFKLIAAQFTSGKVFFFVSGNTFKVWGMASGFPVLACFLTTGQPGTFTTDFPAAIQISNPLLIEMSSLG